MNSEDVKLIISFNMKDGSNRRIVMKPFRKLLSAKADKVVNVVQFDLRLLTGHHKTHDDGRVTIFTEENGPVTIDENNCMGWCYRNRNAQKGRLI